MYKLRIITSGLTQQYMICTMKAKVREKIIKHRMARYILKALKMPSHKRTEL